MTVTNAATIWKDVIERSWQALSADEAHTILRLNLGKTQRRCMADLMRLSNAGDLSNSQEQELESYAARV